MDEVLDSNLEANLQEISEIANGEIGVEQLDRITDIFSELNSEYTPDTLRIQLNTLRKNNGDEKVTTSLTLEIYRLENYLKGSKEDYIAEIDRTVEILTALRDNKTLQLDLSGNAFFLSRLRKSLKKTKMCTSRYDGNMHFEFRKYDGEDRQELIKSEIDNLLIEKNQKEEEKKKNMDARSTELLEKKLELNSTKNRVANLNAIADFYKICQTLPHFYPTLRSAIEIDKQNGVTFDFVETIRIIDINEWGFVGAVSTKTIQIGEVANFVRYFYKHVEQYNAVLFQESLDSFFGIEENQGISILKGKSFMMNQEDNPFQATGIQFTKPGPGWGADVFINIPSFFLNRMVPGYSISIIGDSADSKLNFTEQENFVNQAQIPNSVGDRPIYLVLRMPNRIPLVYGFIQGKNETMVLINNGDISSFYIHCSENLPYFYTDNQNLTPNQKLDNTIELIRIMQNVGDKEKGLPNVGKHEILRNLEFAKQLIGAENFYDDMSVDNAITHKVLEERFPGYLLDKQWNSLLTAQLQNLERELINLSIDNPNPEYRNGIELNPKLDIKDLGFAKAAQIIHSYSFENAEDTKILEKIEKYYRLKADLKPIEERLSYVQRFTNDINFIVQKALELKLNESTLASYDRFLKSLISNIYNLEDKNQPINIRLFYDRPRSYLKLLDIRNRLKDESDPINIIVQGYSTGILNKAIVLNGRTSKTKVLKSKESDLHIVENYDSMESIINIIKTKTSEFNELIYILYEILRGHEDQLNQEEEIEQRLSSKKYYLGPEEVTAEELLRLRKGEEIRK